MDSTTLKEIEDLAGLNYTPAQIALIMGFEDADVRQWMEDEASDFFRAFQKGFYTTDIALRKSIFKLADAGSSPAQSLARKIQEENELRRHYE